MANYNNGGDTVLLWTGMKPCGYFVLALFFAILHHFCNDTLKGTPVNALLEFKEELVGNIGLKAFKKLSQKYQHWVLNIFAFMYKSCLVRSMACGLLQHAWKSLRTTPLTIKQIDRVIALQHRKLSGFRSLTVLFNCKVMWILALISMTVPYSAIFPAGSLTVIDAGGVSVYAYNWRWLAFPYAIGLFITGVTIALGTHSLYNHNTSDLSFAFSHIVATTRNGVFNSVLSGAGGDQLHQVMEGADVMLCFGKDGFVSDSDDYN